MTSNIAELCQNFGIGLLLMYLETVSIKEPPYLIIFSRSFYQKEMEIIGKSKFISKSPWSRVKAKQDQARLFKWPRAWQIKNIYQNIKAKRARLNLRFWIFLGQLNFSISYHIFGHKEVKSLVGKKYIVLPFILKWSHVEEILRNVSYSVGLIQQACIRH